jgi:hypothetical protein
MGACDFSTLEVGRFKRPGDAFNEAREDAEYEYGHDPYNGTISTCDNFDIRDDNPRYGTAAFNKWEDKVLSDLSKRECVCVEITGAVLKRLKERRGYKGKKGIRAFYFFGMAAY